MDNDEEFLINAYGSMDQEMAAKTLSMMKNAKRSRDIVEEENCLSVVKRMRHMEQERDEVGRLSDHILPGEIWNIIVEYSLTTNDTNESSHNTMKILRLTCRLFYSLTLNNPCLNIYVPLSMYRSYVTRPGELPYTDIIKIVISDKDVSSPRCMSQMMMESPCVTPKLHISFKRSSLSDLERFNVIIANLHIPEYVTYLDISSNLYIRRSNMPVFDMVEFTVKRYPHLKTLIVSQELKSCARKCFSGKNNICEHISTLIRIREQFPSFELRFRYEEIRTHISLLSWSCYRGYTELVKHLLTNDKKEGVDKINILDHPCLYPLLEAIESDKQEIVDMLLREGANPNPVFSDSTPADERRVPLSTAIIKFLTESEHVYRPTNMTPELRSLDIVKSLLKHKADPNLDINNDGSLTPLAVAAFTRRYDLFDLLVEYGADATLEMKDIGNATALFMAAHDEVMTLKVLNLLKKNDPNLGESPVATPTISAYQFYFGLEKHDTIGSQVVHIPQDSHSPYAERHPVSESTDDIRVITCTPTYVALAHCKFNEKSPNTVLLLEKHYPGSIMKSRSHALWNGDIAILTYIDFVFMPRYFPSCRTD